LRLTPYAWSKLLYLRDAGETEIGGFGISAADELLLVEDIVLVRQSCSFASVRFDDAAVADFFDWQVDLGRPPEQFGRIWVHTHPGNSPLPSGTDEATFARCFGGADWSIMFILACGGRSYARLRFRTGPGASLILPLEIDFAARCPAMDRTAWDLEYRQNVVVDTGWGTTSDPPKLASVAATRSSGERLSCSDDLLAYRPRYDPWEDLHDFAF